MTSKAKLLEVEAGLQAMLEVHPMEMEVVGHLVEAVVGHQVEVPLVEVMAHQQVVQGPPSRPTEEGHQEVVMVALQEVVMVVLQGVVAARWDQVQLRRMPRWLRASARKLDITGRMLSRNIQVGNLVKSTSIVRKH